MSVKIKGLKKLQKDIKRATQKLAPIVAHEYKKEIVKNLRSSKDTGALINSWKIKTSVFKAEVFSNLPYSLIQNDGGRIKVTKKMVAQFWALFYDTKLVKYKAMALSKFITIPAKHYLDVNERAVMKKADLKWGKITKKI